MLVLDVLVPFAAQDVSSEPVLFFCSCIWEVFHLICLEDWLQCRKIKLT